MENKQPQFVIPVDTDEYSGFAVEPKKDCPHITEELSGNLDTLFSERQDKILTDFCAHCKENQENWICLKCKIIACSRYKNSHMVKHIDQNPDHCIGFSLSDGSFWCYSCDNYIINPSLTALQKKFSKIKFPEQIQEEKNDITAQKEQQQEQEEEKKVEEESEFNGEVPDKEYAFVYGTLKPGYSHIAYNQSLYGNYDTIYFKAKIQNYTLYYDNYPTIWDAQGEYVEGYIVSTQDDSQFKKFIAQCDRIEGCPSYYSRIETKAYVGNKQVKAYAYQMRKECFNESRGKKIGSIYDPDSMSQR